MTTNTEPLAEDDLSALRSVADGKPERSIPAEPLRKLLGLKLIEQKVGGFKVTVRGRAELGRPTK
jgi:hypothetical protein